MSRSNKSLVGLVGFALVCGLISFSLRTSDLAALPVDKSLCEEAGCHVFDPVPVKMRSARPVPIEGSQTLGEAGLQAQCKASAISKHGVDLMMRIPKGHAPGPIPVMGVVVPKRREGGKGLAFPKIR